MVISYTSMKPNKSPLYSEVSLRMSAGEIQNSNYQQKIIYKRTWLQVIICESNFQKRQKIWMPFNEWKFKMHQG